MPDQTPDTTPRVLCERWVRGHSVLMLLVMSWCTWTGRPEWLALYSTLAFPVLVVMLRGHWVPGGGFGLPNVITTLRLLVTVGLLAFPNALSEWTVVVIAGGTCLGDMLDGWLARRAGLASEFGACYDVEVDSILVITLPLLLVARGIVGPWILGVGYWHYVYCLAPVLVRPRVEHLPRSRFGRYIYATMIGTFLLGFLVPHDWATPLAAFGVSAVTVSFLRSFWQRYGVPRTESRPR